MKSIINITNGKYLNNYLQKKYPNEIFIPFNEAMIEGNPTIPIFSESFIDERCHTHQVSKESYFENMKEFLNFSKNINVYDSIKLWFGKDMFCQFNALTILAYLNQQNYHNTINMNLVDEETFEIIESISIPKEDYLSIYKDVFMKHKVISSQINDLNQAIHHYFNMEHEINHLMKENLDLNETDLIKVLLNKTKKYGLGDTQIHKFIQKYKTN